MRIGAKFIRQVQRQQREGFRLAFLEDGGAVRAVAGYRILELFSPAARFTWMIWSRARPTARRVSAGSSSIGWWRRRGGRNAQASRSIPACNVSTPHRFYLMKRMKIASHHFTLALDDRPLLVRPASLFFLAFPDDRRVAIGTDVRRDLI